MATFVNFIMHHPIFTIFFGGILFVLYKVFWEVKRKEGLLISPFSDTSAPNAYNQISGMKWSKLSTLKRVFKENEKRTLKIDNFAKYPSHQRRTSIFRMPFDKGEIFIDPDKLFELMVLVSPMGGGKTVTFDSLLMQNFYDRAIINEEKAGDFVSKHYKKRRDIILCPYDARGQVWDLLSEPLPVIQGALENLMAGILNGQNGDNHFTSAAKEAYLSIARLTIEKNTSKEKWCYFIEELEKYFALVDAGDSKSKKDVVETMKHAINIFKLMRYQIISGKKCFTIKSFFAKKGGAKLFMVKNDLYSVELRCLFSAFYGAFINTHLSMPEYKKTKSRTFYAFDEYPSINLTMDTRKKLHTKIRSKGGAVVIGCHYIDNDPEIQNLMTSTVYAYFIFSIKNEKTKQWIENAVVGKRQYKVIEKNPKGEMVEKVVENPLIQWEDMNDLKSQYMHLTVIPNENNTLYVGKSDYVDLLENVEPFIEEDLNPFYINLNNEFKHELNKFSATKTASEKHKNKKES